MEFPENTVTVLTVLAMLLGVMQCFYGYRLFKWVLSLTGALLGSLLLGSIAMAAFQSQIMAIVAGVIGGLLGSLLLVKLFFFGVFVIGGLLGGVLASAVFTFLSMSPMPVLVIAVAILAGVTALVFQKPMIILSTAFAGAWSIVAGGAHFISGGAALTDFSGLSDLGGAGVFVAMACWLCIGVAGSMFQFRAPMRAALADAKA